MSVQESKSSMFQTPGSAREIPFGATTNNAMAANVAAEAIIRLVKVLVRLDVFLVVCDIAAPP